MLPPPLEHRFHIDGEPYCLKEFRRGGERRIRARYALALTPAPEVLSAADGEDLWVEAVAIECLTEAPVFFWMTQPHAAQHNGTPARVVTLDEVPLPVWSAFKKEVAIFMAMVFPQAPEESQRVPEDRPGEPNHVAPPETVPAAFQGRAQ